MNVRMTQFIPDANFSIKVLSIVVKAAFLVANEKCNTVPVGVSKTEDAFCFFTLEFINVAKAIKGFLHWSISIYLLIGCWLSGDFTPRIPKMTINFSLCSFSFIVDQNAQAASLTLFLPSLFLFSSSRPLPSPIWRRVIAELVSLACHPVMDDLATSWLQKIYINPSPHCHAMRGLGRMKNG